MARGGEGAMTLWIVRHAKAQDRRAGLRDAVRALTPGGRRRFRQAADGLRRRGVRVDLLLHSPKLRAVDTAEMLVPLCTGGTAVSAHLTAKPGAALLAELVGRSVAVVGHEPWLSQLAALLVTGDVADARRFALAKGGVLRLEGRAAPGRMARTGAWTQGDLRR
jgi:phosphohistidine phosphatase